MMIKWKIIKRVYFNRINEKQEMVHEVYLRSSEEIEKDLLCRMDILYNKNNFLSDGVPGVPVYD